MTKRFSQFLIILMMAMSAFSLPAATEIKGHWKGAIELPNGKMDILLSFTQSGGSWEGSISIPAQNARNLPLENIQILDKTWTWAIQGIPGNPSFKGSLAPDGSSINGDFTQGGATFPFSLNRSADPVESGKKDLANLDDLVEKGLQDLAVPGVAVAIVKDNQLLLAKGYGLRNVEKKLPMTADTLLAIGSSSKAFTTFALGTLVDKGELEWDTPLRQYIPWFTLQDPATSERITPRDLVTHRSGLPRHDLVWYNNNALSREELVHRLAYLEPTADLRTRFQYNNMMFLTAGYLLETVSGHKWEKAMGALVFTPLGMTRSNCSVDDSQRDPDHALPYTFQDDRITPLPFRNIDIVGPAGAINSSVREMSRWLLLHLGNGSLESKKLINPSTLSDLHTPYMPLGSESAEPMIQNVGYALGWFVDSYRGHRRIHHGGAIDGFICNVAFLPQDGIGIVVLANMNGTSLPELLTRSIFDRLLGLENRDWIGESAKQRAIRLKAGKEAEQKGRSRRILKTRPAHELNQYIGTFTHPGYGDLTVAIKGKALAFTYNNIFTPLEHWHYETFNGLKSDDPTFEDIKLNFGTDVNGRVAWLEAQFEPSLEPMRFVKKADSRFFNPSYLQTLIGRYDMQGQTVSIVLKGNALCAVIPGQPELDLVPAPGDEFALKQAKAVTMRFLSSPGGQVDRLEINQGGSVFVAKRLPESETKK